MFVYESTPKDNRLGLSLPVLLRLLARLRLLTRLTGAGIMRRLSVLLLVVVSGLGQWAGARDVAVTGVAGRSWLNQLNRDFAETSMGKTGHLGPAVEDFSRWQMGLSTSATDAVSLRGADLYRLNCQSCHGEKGQGAPPEINSVINPVRATSVAMVVER